MKSTAILTLALATAMTAGAALAQQATAPSTTIQKGEPAPGQTRHAGRMMLDTNHDGVIDRAEAAAHPRFAAMFDKLDTNKDGRLEASERPQWAGHGGKPGARGHGNMRRGGTHHGGMHGSGMARLDANGDGRISRDELGKMPRLAEKFSQMDGNKDGYLVRSEMQAYHERMRPQRAAEMQKRFDERFKGADLNKDGKLSKIEVGEKMPRMAKSFSWMDEDRDGFLSRKELQPRHR